MTDPMNIRGLSRQHTEKQSRLKKITFFTLFGFCSLLISLILLEAFIRITLDIYQCHPQLGWTFKPNMSGLKVSTRGEFLQIVRFNAIGLRRLYESPTSNKGHQIILLGDSYSAGLQVGDNQVFSTLVEKLINEKVVAREDQITIINAEVDGYGTTQELLLYERLTLGKPPPAAVLLEVFL